MSSPHVSLPPIKVNQLPDTFPEFENSYNHPCPIQISFDLEASPEELHNGLKEIAKYAPHKNVRISEGPSGSPNIRGSTCPYEWCLSFHHDVCLELGALSVKYFPTASTVKLQVHIEYSRPIEAFKALGILLGLAFETRKINPVDLTEKTFEELLNFSKKAQFDTLCLMIDCSRNAVTSVPALFKMLRFSALLGYNMLQLYTEDTYEIKGEPFFGYFRGGYTQDELSMIDNYAFALGIEVVPCIQTLGHLGQILQWPQYNNLKDTNEVLLTKFNETYDFIEKMIVASSQSLRSKRIHLGMDEAYGLGEGRYRQFFGQEDNTQIFVDHLQRIKEICSQHGLKPMIWSDMLFCLGAKNMSLASYYDENCQPATINLDPGNKEELELVFWDYYHTSPDIYIQKFRNHRELGCASPWMAAGAWTWSRFWCAMQFSIKAAQACLQASKDPVDGVRNFMLTIWGDEGAECDYFSSLPIMMYTSLQAYSSASEVPIDTYEAHFAGVCGGNLHSWYKASQLDELPFDNDFKDLATVQADLPPVQFPPNTSKHLLWEDPFYAIFSPSYADLDLEAHYSQLAAFLSSSDTDLYPLDHHLRLPIYLAKVLSLKVNLRSMLVELYRRGQRQELRQFASQRISELRSALVLQWNYHRSLWLGNNKPFGWEVLELRYGGLMARVDTLASRISDYCDYSSKLTIMPSIPPPDPDSMEIDLDDSPCQSLVTNGISPPHISPVQPINQTESPSTQLAVWPEHSVYPNGELNISIASIPEFEVETLTSFTPSRHNMIIEYSRASSVSRLG